MLQKIERIAPHLIAAGQKLNQASSELKICVAPAPSIMPLFQSLFPDLPENWIVLEESELRHEAMAAATLALTCSGTVNTELAVQGTPIITGYRTGVLTATILLNFLMKADYITLLNMAAGEMIVPEYLQEAFTAEAIVSAALPLLEDPHKRRAQIEAQDAALAKMGYGSGPPADRAADIILSDLQA